MYAYTTVRPARRAANVPAQAAPTSYFERQDTQSFGTGYGRSSGYAARPRYTRDWGPARFTLR